MTDNRNGHNVIFEMKKNATLPHYPDHFAVATARRHLLNGLLNVRKVPLYVEGTASEHYRKTCTIDIEGNIEGIKRIGHHGFSYKFSKGKGGGYISWSVVELLIMNFPYFCPPRPEGIGRVYPYLLPNRHHVKYVRWYAREWPDAWDESIPIAGWDTVDEGGFWRFRGHQASSVYTPGETYAVVRPGGLGMNVEGYARWIIEISASYLPGSWKGEKEGRFIVVPDIDGLWVPFTDGGHDGKVQTYRGITFVNARYANTYYPEIYKKEE